MNKKQVLDILTNDASSLFTNKFTMSFWWNITYTSTTNTGRYICASRNYYTVGEDGNFSYRVDPPNSITFQSYDGQSSRQIVTSTGLSLQSNTWMNTVVTSDGTTAGTVSDGVVFGISYLNILKEKTD